MNVIRRVWDRVFGLFRAANGSVYARFMAFLMFVVAILLAVYGFQAESRSQAIHEIREAATRIEAAAVHTEEVLVGVVESQNSPEAIARNEEVTEALRDIREIKLMLCEVFPNHEFCPSEE